MQDIVFDHCTILSAIRKRKSSKFARRKARFTKELIIIGDEDRSIVFERS